VAGVAGVMAAPRYERVCELDLLAWEAALQAAAATRNGHGLPADAVWVISARALAAPATAARCPHVRAALPADVRAAVLRMAADHQGVRQLAGEASEPAHSPPTDRPWTTAEAATALRITTHGARDACRRGALTADHDPATGRWRIAAGSVAQYQGRPHA
jgi:hypothetical protein